MTGTGISTTPELNPPAPRFFSVGHRVQHGDQLVDGAAGARWAYRIVISIMLWPTLDFANAAEHQAVELACAAYRDAHKTETATDQEALTP